MKQRSFRQEISLMLITTLVMSSAGPAQAQTSRTLPNRMAQAFTTQLDSTMPPKITALIQQLKHPQADKRIAAATQLGERRESAKVTVPYLIPLLQDPDPNVRISACQAFQKMQESASAAIPYLIPLLRDPNVEVRIWVPYALAEMGDLASAAVPELERLRQDLDQNVDVNIGAAMALSRIDRETRTQKLTALITAMQDKNSKVRSQATFSLNQMGRFAKDSIPQLMELLRDARSDVRENAVAVLSNISVSTQKVSPPIQPLRTQIPLSSVLAFEASPQFKPIPFQSISPIQPRLQEQNLSAPSTEYFGKPIEAYAIRPGLLLSITRNAQGQPKTMLVESTMANRDEKTIDFPGMLSKETIDTLIDQLVPISSRGIKIKTPEVGSCIDFCYFPLSHYENVSIDLITQTIWQEIGQPFSPTRKDNIPKLMISWKRIN